MEVFKTIKNNLNYLIGDHGTIKSKSTGKVLKQRIGKQGLNLITINHCGPKNYYTRRLVAEHFVPNPMNLDCVAHLNHDRLDNRAVNLVWATQSDIKTKYSKLSVKIKIKGSNGYFKSIPRCAEYFGVNTQDIARIIKENETNNIYGLEWN
jgi:hypothetical protein